MGYTLPTDYAVIVLKGDTVIGQFHMYGMTDVYSVSRDSDAGIIYVDEFFLTVEQAVRSLRQKGCRQRSYCWRTAMGADDKRDGDLLTHVPSHPYACECLPRLILLPSFTGPACSPGTQGPFQPLTETG